MEVGWRIEELPLSDESHSIVRLAVHTENQQLIIKKKKRFKIKKN